MFIAALFTVAKIWKQPVCLSVDKWIMKIKYTKNIYNEILFSHNIACNLAIYNNMDEPKRPYAK